MKMNQVGLSFHERELEVFFCLDDAKKLIEELAHEKSRLEIELEKYRSENTDLQTK